MQHFLITLSMVLTIVFPPLTNAAPNNIVLMVVDDQGLDAGCYGNKVIQTPHIDQLASEGTRFNYAFCTTSSCSASRSVILTGLYNHANGQYGHRHGIHNFHSFGWVRGLPVLLSEAGYRTCCVGKYHVQPKEVYRFDRHANEGLVGGSRSAVQMAENAEKFIRADDSRPFFLYFCPSDPHRSQDGRFGNGHKYPGVKEIVYDPKDIPVPSFLPDLPETHQELAEYYQSISRADQGLGRLIQVLKDTGHYDDTLIIYCSDNGCPFPGAKTTLYEPGMRLPMVVRSPNQKTKGQFTNAMVTYADLTPTIIDFAGAKGPKYPLHGRSFLNTVDETNPGGWDEIYASHTFHGVTEYYPVRLIRTRKYKCIYNIAYQLPFPFASDLYGSTTWQAVLKGNLTQYGKRSVNAYVHRPRFELYDLESDPDEVVNLAGSPKHTKILAELQAKIRVWQEKTKDPWLYKYEYD